METIGINAGMKVLIYFCIFIVVIFSAAAWYFMTLSKNKKETVSSNEDSSIPAGFKKSPLHDKNKIMEVLDNLEPEDMCKVVDF